jgi:hypothetical protein
MFDRERRARFEIVCRLAERRIAQSVGVGAIRQGDVENPGSDGALPGALPS